MRPLLFVVLVALMNIPDALGQTSLQSFLGAVFDGRRRAVAIALRNKFGNAAVPVVTIITGLAITYIPRSDSQRMLLYQAFFIAAFAFGLVEVSVFRRFKTAPDAIAPHHAGRSRAHILRDKRFIAFLWPLLFFTFCWQAAWPICALYQVGNLRANEFWFALFGVASGAGAFFSAGVWQKLTRKRGNTFTLAVSAAGLGMNIVLFPLCPNVVAMTFTCAFGGAVSVGFNIASLNGVLAATPDDHRLSYMAFYNTAVNLSLFAAPLASHLLLQFMDIRALFFLLAGLRFVSAGVMYVVHSKTPTPAS
jgi:MFS family permease